MEEQEKKKGKKGGPACVQDAVARTGGASKERDQKREKKTRGGCLYVQYAIGIALHIRIVRHH